MRFKRYSDPEMATTSMPPGPSSLSSFVLLPPPVHYHLYSEGQESDFTQGYYDKSKQWIPKAGSTLSQCPFHYAYLHATDCFNHLESEEWPLYPIMFKLDKSNDRNQNERTVLSLDKMSRFLLSALTVSSYL